MEQVDDRPAISHDRAGANELTRRRRVIVPLMVASMVALGLTTVGMCWVVRRGSEPTREAGEGMDAADGTVWAFLFTLVFAGLATVRVLDARRLRRALRDCDWREVELSSFSGVCVASEPSGVHWFVFPEPVPRHFRAAISTHDSGSRHPRRWCAIRPIETERVFLVRVRRDKPRARTERATPEEPGPRWRGDDRTTVPCTLTSAGIERARTDDAGSQFAILVLHRPDPESRLDVWLPRGPRLGHVEETDRGAELRSASGSLVIELERRFGVAVFRHRGMQVGSSNGPHLCVGDDLLSSPRWRRFSRLSGLPYRMLGPNGEVVASARQRGLDAPVALQLAPGLDPVAAAVILIQVAQRLT